jgi:hyperosmotically inducible protein
MKSVLGVGLLLLMALPTAARDPATPPALGDPAGGGERSPDANPTRAQNRFDAETRPESDELLASAVHQRLSDDPRVNGSGIRVDARAGEVELTGQVVSASERDTAGEIAQQVAGVRKVQNRLTVARSLTPVPGGSAIPELPAP